MVTILISATFIGAAFVRGESLLEGGVYVNVDTQRCGAYLWHGAY